MTKEELIKFIESVEFETATNLVLTYCKKKPKNTPYYSEEDRCDMEKKTITFNKDFEHILNEQNNWINRRIDDVYEGIRQLEEKINKENK